MVNTLTLIHCLRPLTQAPKIPGLDVLSTIFHEDVWRDPKIFSLQTCQRILLVSTDRIPSNYIKKSDAVEIYHDSNAYMFLLQTLCGLKSQVIAEYEIVGQFREAYAQFVVRENRCTKVMHALEKLLKDSKEVRTNYLMKIGQLSYAGLARKLVIEKNLNGKILILGSGKLAEDLAGVLSKKFQVVVSARNHARQKELKSKFKVETCSLVNEQEFLDFPIIINTIASNTPTIFQNSGKLVNAWANIHGEEQRLIIDMSSPGVINGDFGTADGVYRLEDLFDLAKTESAKAQEKVESALNAISHLVNKRTVLPEMMGHA